MTQIRRFAPIHGASAAKPQGRTSNCFLACIAAFALSFLAADAIADEIYSFGHDRLKQLPEVIREQTIEAPAALAQRMLGTPGLPRSKGDYILYQHGVLWYFFGPYDDRPKLANDYRTLIRKRDELRNQNPKRYAEAYVIMIEAKSDDWIAHMFSTDKNALRFQELLASYRALEKIKILEQDVARAKTDSQALAGINKVVTALAISRSGVTGGHGEALAAFGSQGGVSTDEADQLRTKIGAALMRKSLGALIVDDAISRGMGPSGAGTFGTAARRIVQSVQGGQALQDRGARTFEGIAKRQSSVSPKTVSDAMGELGGAIVSAALGGGTSGIGAMSTAELKELSKKLRGADAGLAAEAVDREARKAEKRPDKPYFDPAGFGGLLQGSLNDLPTPKHSADGANALADQLEGKGVDIDAAAWTGLNGYAARDLGAAAAAAFAAQAQAVTGTKKGSPLTQEQLKKLKEFAKAAGVDGPKIPLIIQEKPAGEPDGQKVGLMLDEIGQAMAHASMKAAIKNDLVGATQAGSNGNQGSSISNLNNARVAAGLAPLSPSSQQGEPIEGLIDRTAGELAALLTDPDASPNASGPSLSGDAVGDVTESVGKNVARAGEKGSGKRSKRGSGGLPLPGSAPALELLARAILRYFGVDASLAKQLLVVLYQLDPEKFTRIAEKMEELHDQLVSARDAKNLNEVNKALELLDKIEAVAADLEVDLKNLVEKDLNAALKEVANAGLNALKEEGVKELAKKTGLTEGTIRALVGKPLNFEFAKVPGAIETGLKDWAKNEARKRGVDPQIWDAVVAGDTTKLSNLVQEGARKAVNDELRRSGLSPGTVDALRLGKWAQVGAALRDRATEVLTKEATDLSRQGLDRLRREGANQIAKRLGIPLARAQQIVNSKDVAEATNVLKATAASAAQDAAARRLGKDAIAALQRGDFPTAAVTIAKAKAKDQLVRAGMSPELAGALAKGDRRTVQNELSRLTESTAETLAVRQGASTAVTNAIRLGDYTSAAEIWTRELRAILESAVARNIGVGAEVVKNGVSILSDSRALQENLRKQAKSELDALERYLGDNLTFDVSQLDIKNVRDVLYALQGKIGAAELSKLLGVTEANLRTFVQGAGGIERVGRAIQALPDKIISDNLNNEAERLRSWLEQLRIKEERKLKIAD